MSKHKRRLKRRIEGKLVDGITLEPPEEAAEESDAWARSAEGQATFRELLRGKENHHD